MKYPARQVRGLEISPERIRWAMEMHGESVHQAARRMGVNYRTLQRWRAGSPPRGLLQRQALLSYIYGAIRLEASREDASESVTPL